MRFCTKPMHEAFAQAFCMCIEDAELVASAAPIGGRTQECPVCSGGFRLMR
jgi:hypothetical protein